MLVSFILSMPNIGSWDGKWSGSENLYARVRSFRGKEKETQAKELIEKGYFRYDFGDGWSAGVSVKRVDSKEANKINRKTKGFCMYDWMIDSIIKNKKIVYEES